MNAKDISVIADLMRDLYGSRAEEFTLRMVRHFETQNSTVAKLWRNVHDCLRFIPVSSLPKQPFARRKSAKAQHLDGEAR